MLSNNSSGEIERCAIHKKKTEILCLYCRVKLCTNCALFGGHKVHDVMPIEDAIQKISARAEAIYELHQAVDQARKDIIDEDFLQTEMKQHLNKQKEELQTLLELIFKDIQDQVEAKKRKIEEDIKKKIIQMEEACIRFLKDLTIDIGGKADLWCMNTKSKLSYFAEQTEKGEIPIDFLTIGENNTDILIIGQQLLRELEESKENLCQKMGELGQKKITLEYKGGLDRVLDTLFTLVIKTNNNTAVTFPNTQPNSRQGSTASKLETSVNQSFMNMVLSDMQTTDPFLLKDMNNSSLMDPLGNLQLSGKFQEAINQSQLQKPLEIKSPKKVSFVGDKFGVGRIQSQTLLPQTLLPDYRSPSEYTSSTNSSTSNLHQTQLKQTSRSISITIQNYNKDRDASPSPTNRRATSKPKMNKVPERFQNIVFGVKQDSIECADFTGAELGDGSLLYLIPFIVNSTRLRLLKLGKNKIGDQAALTLLSAVLQEQNKDQYSLPTNTLASINLSQNVITEKVVDLLLELGMDLKYINYNIKARHFSDSIHVQSLRCIYLNQNAINKSRVKKKLEELKKIGVDVQI